MSLYLLRENELQAAEGAIHSLGSLGLRCVWDGSRAGGDKAEILTGIYEAEFIIFGCGLNM